jgi:5-methylthioadenosine/S-adenosylhomocysteine deaminase
MMPGLVNGQAHGMPVGDRWPLELFLTAMSGRAGNRTLEDKYLNGLLAAVEMIRKGCTALQEW